MIEISLKIVDEGPIDNKSALVARIKIFATGPNESVVIMEMHGINEEVFFDWSNWCYKGDNPPQSTSGVFVK